MAFGHKPKRAELLFRLFSRQSTTYQDFHIFSDMCFVTRPLIPIHPWERNRLPLRKVNGVSQKKFLKHAHNVTLSHKYVLRTMIRVFSFTSNHLAPVMHSKCPEVWKDKIVRCIPHLISENFSFSSLVMTLLRAYISCRCRALTSRVFCIRYEFINIVEPRSVSTVSHPLAITDLFDGKKVLRNWLKEALLTAFRRERAVKA